MTPMGLDRRALAASLLEREIRPKPPADEMSPPVAWLLGPEMVGGLKSFLLYASYKGELDVHDWMHAEPIAYEPADGASDFWFDFVSDIGDGQRAMYTTAVVVQDDLHVEGALDALAAAKTGRAQVPAVGAAPAGWSTLPRGRVLVVGGDTAYPLADTINLEHHVRQPFTWAYRDLVAAGRLVDDDGRARGAHDIVGIPGNHDYYDQLTGFNRMFRAPLTNEAGPAPRGKRPPLALLGLTRRQNASYFALHLPWQWQLWGLDPADDGFDFRQEFFFRAQGAPRKRIVLTPSPPVAFGRVIAPRAVLAGLARLGLVAPYLDGTAALLDGHAPDPAWPRALAPGTCQIDLSGDMHHYERYGATAAQPAYAAIVSGAGGAFHHPTYTDFGEVTTDALYPSKASSRHAVAAALFHPRTIFNGGIVNISAFAVALILCAGSIRMDTRVVTDWLLGWLGVRGERPWFTSDAPGGWYTAPWSSLRGVAIFSGSIAVSIAMVLVALGYARWVTRTIRLPRHQWPWAMRAMRALPIDRILDERGYLPSWLLVMGAAALPAVIGQLVDLPGGGAALLFQLLFLSTLVAIAAAMMLLAVGLGGEFARPRERPAFWALGAVHAGIQLTLPLLLIRVGLGHPVSLAFAAGAAIGLGYLSRQVLARGGGRLVLVLLWLGHWVAIVAILEATTDDVAVYPVSTGGWVLFLTVAGAIGSIVGCVEYGWYLAVAGALGGHNNEVGAAARIEGFRQFIRFRLEPDRLTGYVIAIDETATDPAAVKPRVVDVFTIRAG
jgi:hypothetical protein